MRQIKKSKFNESSHKTGCLLAHRFAVVVLFPSLRARLRLHRCKFPQLLCRNLVAVCWISQLYSPLLVETGQLLTQIIRNLVSPNSQRRRKARKTRRLLCQCSHLGMVQLPIAAQALTVDFVLRKDNDFKSLALLSVPRPH